MSSISHVRNSGLIASNTYNKQDKYNEIVNINQPEQVIHNTVIIKSRNNTDKYNNHINMLGNLHLGQSYCVVSGLPGMAFQSLTALIFKNILFKNICTLVMSIKQEF